VYGIAILASIHFFIQSKLDVTQAVLMSGLLIWLFGYRIWHRRTNAVGPRDLLALAPIAGVLTALLEMAWYGALTGISPWVVGEANFQPSLGISPAAYVLGSGLFVAAAAWVRLHVLPPAKLAKARAPAQTQKGPAA
ncbi:MAG: hypothetical protein B7Y75_07230, partial [Azorhizobium sp. 35-67-5]